MSERLTPEQLDELRARFPTHLGEPKPSVLIQMAAREIKDRRALDLTAEEIEALAVLREHLRLALERTEAVHREWKELSLTALEKVLARGGGR